MRMGWMYKVWVGSKYGLGQCRQYRGACVPFVTFSAGKRHSLGKVEKSREVAGSSHQLDGGFTLVEMLISMLVMALVVSMTLVIVTNVLTGTASSTRLGVSAANVELGASEVAQYVRSTITPGEAANLASTSSCIGTTAVISAEPFFMEFCGKSPVASYNSGSAYNDYVLDTASCTNGKAYSYCDFQLLDTSTAPWSTVWSMASVWCDSQCQSDVENFLSPPWPIGHTPAMFKYCMVSPQSTSGPPEVEGCTSNTSGTSVSGFSCTVNGSSASGDACIGAVQISVTVLANPQATQSATPTKPPLGSTVTQTIILTNVISQFGS